MIQNTNQPVNNFNNSVNKKGKNLVEGIVVEALPNTQFKVQIEPSKDEIRAYLGGRMKQNRIKVFVGDRVSILLDQYGESHRIERRV
jgi:translation initiation factor IF-1